MGYVPQSRETSNAMDPEIHLRIRRRSNQGHNVCRSSSRPDLLMTIILFVAGASPPAPFPSLYTWLPMGATPRGSSVPRSWSPALPYLSATSPTASRTTMRLCNRPVARDQMILYSVCANYRSTPSRRRWICLPGYLTSRCGRPMYLGDFVLEDWVLKIVLEFGVAAAGRRSVPH